MAGEKVRRTYALMLLLLTAGVGTGAAKRKPDSQQVRAAYLATVEQQNIITADGKTAGSLWSPNGLLADMTSDYRASHLNDTLTIRVVEQTTAKSTGNVTSQRSVQVQSAIDGLAAHLSTRGVNPILSAQSATNLKGQGQAAADSNLRTSLTGQVIAVLPNGNLVVEAERQIAMNNQRETMVVRGVLRPGDIASDNSVVSTALSHLEIELKGKGVVSDATRPINPVLRRLLWLIGF